LRLEEEERNKNIQLDSILITKSEDRRLVKEWLNI
jgi:hypothetical protein